MCFRTRVRLPPPPPAFARLRVLRPSSPSYGSVNHRPSEPTASSRAAGSPEGWCRAVVKRGTAAIGKSPLEPPRIRIPSWVASLQRAWAVDKRFVYILRSLPVRDRRYVGLTADVRHRLEAHNRGLTPSTARYRPWALTVVIEFTDTERAGRVERYLKSPSGRAFARRHFAVE